mmetsp:Transcript_6636/g.8275  ORF Transcript_6636/g.8275 Transcript_6636/m.8275 type:complete len:147 (-) Transcript_6636:114-554(-)
MDIFSSDDNNDNVDILSPDNNETVDTITPDDNVGAFSPDNGSSMDENSTLQSTLNDPFVSTTETMPPISEVNADSSSSIKSTIIQNNKQKIEGSYLQRVRLRRRSPPRQLPSGARLRKHIPIVLYEQDEIDDYRKLDRAMLRGSKR